ncbi:MAG: chemotaxis protein CheW [Proteobacteria bacterium]|nr:chemotaxis protein CheW [Pseudomonadota bacterium]
MTDRANVVSLRAKETSIQMSEESRRYVTMFVDRQMFGLPVLCVQDVLKKQVVTHIPLSPPEVAGALNLRGRIVTVIDMRKRLGISEITDDSKTMKVVVDHQGEPYSLIVDAVGDVLNLSEGQFESTPPNLAPAWASVADGVCRLEDKLMVVLDVKKLLQY